MWKRISIATLVMFSLTVVSRGQESISDTPHPSSLVAVQVIFRHGERAIEEPLPFDLYNDEKHWPNGFGQLTCGGKLQCYNLGRFLRQRYATFINTTYIHRELHTLSSDMDRTIQSANSVLAGFYPPNEEVLDCLDIPWKDVPVHTLPPELDNAIHPELDILECPNYVQHLGNVLSLPDVKDLIMANEDVFKEFAANVNIKDHTNILLFAKFYDNLRVEDYFNLTLPVWTQRVLKEIKMFSFFQLMTYTKEMKRLRAGPLFHRLLNNFNMTLQGKVGKEQGRLIYLISGHDLTHAAFLDTLHLYTNEEDPAYASAVILELHRDQNSSELQLQLFRKNETNSDKMERLEIPGCPSPCPYQDFIALVDPFRVDFETWTNECFPFEDRKPIFMVAGWIMITMTVLTLLVMVGHRIYYTLKTRRHYAPL